MGNACSCICQSEVVSGLGKGGYEETSAPAVGGERGSSSHPSLEQRDGGERSEWATPSGNVTSNVEDRIERSKVHWSQLTERESDLDDEQVVQENRRVFKELQLHPTWGHFFKTFEYDRTRLRFGQLVVKEKFAEGGQAELFHAKVIWKNPTTNEEDLKEGREWVLKVFKRGTRLHELQSQWPLGYLEWQRENLDRSQRGLPAKARSSCDVNYGTLLEDGRFAFLLVKEDEDLRSRIDRAMLRFRWHHRPFPKKEVERIMMNIALGMDWLHSHNILHRDLKASNVLVKEFKNGLLPAYYVADYECSVGVVGTGFFMAPEILHAIKNKTVSKESKVFSKGADVYSYAMTCYEVLTAKFPFEGYPRNDYDVVLHGQRPRIPKHVDSWIKELLCRCWDADCSKRPLFPEIIEILSCNSVAARRVHLDRQKYDEEVYRKYEERETTRRLD